MRHASTNYAIPAIDVFAVPQRKAQISNYYESSRTALHAQKAVFGSKLIPVMQPWSIATIGQFFGSSNQHAKANLDKRITLKLTEFD